MRERVKDEPLLAAARKLLIESGDAADAVAKFPAEQVFVTHLFRKGRIRQDEAMKWISVPFWQDQFRLTVGDLWEGSTP